MTIITCFFLVASKKDVKDIKETTNKSNKDEKNVTFNENEKNLNSEKKNSQDVSKKTHFSKNVSINGDKMMEEDPPSSRQNSESDESSLLDENRGSKLICILNFLNI